MDNIKRLRIRRFIVILTAINLVGQISLYRRARAEVEQEAAAAK